MLLLDVAGLAFTVGGAVRLLPDDLLRFLSLLGLLSRCGEFAPMEEPAGATLEAGDLVAGLLHAAGRLRESLLVLFAFGGRMGDQQRPVARPAVDQGGELVASGAKVVLAHASRVHHLASVGGQPLAAVAARHHAKLVGLILGVRSAAGTSRPSRSRS